MSEEPPSSHQPANIRLVEISAWTALPVALPPRLRQLGYTLYQALDANETPLSFCLVPPLCRVAAGPFRMGSDRTLDKKADPHEEPQHLVTLAAYRIAQFPLTVAEYACFLQGTAQRELPRRGITWQDQLARGLDHPVVNLSFSRFLAYAAWLTHLTNTRWRPPTEAEWEKAARGTDGRLYPWGNRWDKTRANTSAGGPGQTTPVGSYPTGSSPYGLFDMAGNVWEWASSSNAPALCGGSFDDEPALARAAARYDLGDGCFSDNADGAYFYTWGGRLIAEEPDT